MTSWNKNQLWLCSLFCFVIAGFVLLANGCGQGKAAESDSGKGLSIKTSGRLGSLKMPDGSVLSIPGEATEVAEKTLLSLDERKSKSLTVYPDSGEIEFIGKVNAELRKNGFYTEQGQFVAAFAGGKQTFYQVVTPNAVFGIRGTRISFNLSRGTGDVTLLEGSASVAPPDKPTNETHLKPGETVSITNSGFVISRPGGGSINDGNATDTLKTDPERRPVIDIDLHEGNELGQASATVLDLE